MDHTLCHTLLFEQRLKMAGLGLGIDVHIMEIPVSYANSQEVLDDIWQSMTPKVTNNYLYIVEVLMKHFITEKGI